MGDFFLMSKKVHSQLFHKSSCGDVQPCIVSSVDFSFVVIFVDWQKCGLRLNISTNLSHYLCFRKSGRWRQYHKLSYNSGLYPWRRGWFRKQLFVLPP